MGGSYTEAQCPECSAWSRIAPTGPYIVPGPEGEGPYSVDGPWWWTDANNGTIGCPKCGATILPESRRVVRVIDAGPTPESPEVTAAVEEAKLLIAQRHAKLRARTDLDAEGNLAAGLGLHHDREGDDP